jgi:hypothetical protein
MSVQFCTDGSDNSSNQIHPAHLPWLLSLYDALTDDDVDVREAAAKATSPILSLALVPVEACARLLRWLAGRFGYELHFLMHISERMVGHNFGSTSFATHATAGGVVEVDGLGWVSAKSQLEDAMRFDDSLFIIEEHNQYIDEVREARRWADVFLSSGLPRAGDDGANTNKALEEWTLAGLRTLTQIAQLEAAVTGDGPLGWTSKPQVFAICARILICASALVELEGGHCQGQGQGDKEAKEQEGNVYTDISEELRRFWELGRGEQAKIHGLLLRMCGIGTSSRTTTCR